MFSEKKTDKAFQLLKVVTPLYLSYGSCLSSCLWETYKIISLAAILSVYVGKCVCVYLFNKHFSTAISAFCKQLNEFSYSPFREIVFPTPISLFLQTCKFKHTEGRNFMGVLQLLSGWDRNLVSQSVPSVTCCVASAFPWSQSPGACSSSMSLDFPLSLSHLRIFTDLMDSKDLLCNRGVNWAIQCAPSNGLMV